MICEIGTMFWHFSDLNNVIKCPQCHEMNLIITNEYPGVLKLDLATCGKE